MWSLRGLICGYLGATFLRPNPVGIPEHTPKVYDTIDLWPSEITPLKCRKKHLKLDVDVCTLRCYSYARSSCCWCCCRCRWLLLDVDVVHFDFTAAYLLHLRTCDIYRLGPLLTAIIKDNKYSSVRRLIVFAVVTSPLWARDGSIYRWYLADIDISVSYRHFRYRFLSASLYVSKRGAYWDRLCRDVVGRWLVGRWLSRACTVAKRCILGL